VILRRGGPGRKTATVSSSRVVSTPDDLAVAASHSVDPARRKAMFDELMGRIAGRFARVEPRRRTRKLVLGLLAHPPHKNC
jgi:hypothetical protein